ncbi:unnamed protein product [Amoebophrya sp. A120]|nr:unnamed protein product [Amoebophrya sp. A120]|eukprot:GSA120T00025534001.1
MYNNSYIHRKPMPALRSMDIFRNHCRRNGRGTTEERRKPARKKPNARTRTYSDKERKHSGRCRTSSRKSAAGAGKEFPVPEANTGKRRKPTTIRPRCSSKLKPRTFVKAPAEKNTECVASGSRR